MAGLKSYGVEIWTSAAFQNLKRRQAALKRQLKRAPRIVHYFHRLDDPYSQLMVQILPEFANRFDILIRPHVVERLPAAMYPDPARYEALSILDAGRLARLYGLGFSGNAVVPDRLLVGMAARYLAELEDDPIAFLEIAQELGAALWRQDIRSVRAIAGRADLDDQRLRRNEALLAELGFYASGALIYEGEIYPGPDRLDHLERRLNKEGAGDGRIMFDLTRNFMPQLELNNVSLEPERENRLGSQRSDWHLSGRELEIFFSLRSPYSYLGLEKAIRFAERTDVRLKLRPILPMVMRGLPVPSVKRFYIVQDTAREARAAHIPFGRLADPLGAAVLKGLSYGFHFAEEGQEIAFYRSWMRHCWSKGNIGLSEKGMRRILASAGLQVKPIKALDETSWSRQAEENCNAMLSGGSWGVPSFRVDGQIFWGQDRLWAAVEQLRHACQTENERDYTRRSHQENGRHSS